jgi:hypothetical protein
MHVCMSVCVAKWIRSRAVMLHCTTSLTDPGSNPGAGTVNQTVHPSGVGKMVAISTQWVTTNYIPYVGFLQSTRVCDACLYGLYNCFTLPLPVCVKEKQLKNVLLKL